jgi:hypothetical protein
MEKWENVAQDKRNPRSGFKNVQFKILQKEDLTDHIKKITVEIK